MSRIDENGVRHPSGSDLIDERVKIHLAYCRECNLYALAIPRQGIVSPCHGAKLAIYCSETGGSGFQTYQEPSEVVCTAPGCVNSWKPDGTVEYWREEE